MIGPLPRIDPLMARTVPIYGAAHRDDNLARKPFASTSEVEVERWIRRQANPDHWSMVRLQSDLDWLQRWPSWVLVPRPERGDLPEDDGYYDDGEAVGF